MAKRRKNYSKQFKIDAVKLITEQGYKVTEAARNLGIDHTMLRRWKKEVERFPRLCICEGLDCSGSTGPNFNKFHLFDVLPLC